MGRGSATPYADPPHTVGARLVVLASRPSGASRAEVTEADAALLPRDDQAKNALRVAAALSFVTFEERGGAIARVYAARAAHGWRWCGRAMPKATEPHSSPRRARA